MIRPVAHVINLDRRPDRWLDCQQAWSPFFDLVRFPAVDDAKGARGCKLSHVRLAEHVLADHAFLLVLEDDATPTPAFARLGLDCLAQAQQHLFDWDCCLLGAFLDLSPIRLKRATLTPTDSPLFLKSDYGHNTHAVLYNHRSLPLLQASLTSPLPVDMWIGSNAHDLWVPVRTLARQSFSQSDIREPFPNQHKLYDLSDERLAAAVSDNEILNATYDRLAPESVDAPPVA